MNKRKILLIGILPPPINGQSLAFQALTNELKVETLIISSKRNINIWNKISKIFNYFGILFQLIFKLCSQKYVVYYTISQSKEGLRNELVLPLNKKIFILQGSGINIERGAEEAVEAMQSVDNSILLIAGSGDVISQLKSMVGQLQLEEKVIFKNKMPAGELRKYTFAADVGLSIDKDTNLNYRYSLPNKLFDYIHAGIPVVASNLVEVSAIVNKYNVGLITAAEDARSIASCMNLMINDKQQYENYKANTLIASKELNWQNEQQTLLAIFSNLD